MLTVSRLFVSKKKRFLISPETVTKAATRCFFAGLLACAVPVTPGCGDDGGGGGGGARLDCDWLSGGNCWKDSLAAARACLPPDTEEGVYNQGRTSCTYADGTLVSFDQPEWDVVVTRDGVTCLAFVELNPGYRLESSIGTLWLEATEPSEPVVCHCPDGTRAVTYDYTGLYSCDGFMAIMPSVTTGGNYLELNGGPGNEPVMVYNCRDQ